MTIDIKNNQQAHDIRELLRMGGAVKSNLWKKVVPPGAQTYNRGDANIPKHIQDVFDKSPTTKAVVGFQQDLRAVERAVDMFWADARSKDKGEMVAGITSILGELDVVDLKRVYPSVIQLLSGALKEGYSSDTEYPNHVQSNQSANKASTGMKTFSQFANHLLEARSHQMSGGGATIKATPGDTMSFHHHELGHVTGTFTKPVKLGGRTYAGIEHGGYMHAVPIHQITHHNGAQLKEDIDVESCVDNGAE